MSDEFFFKYGSIEGKRTAGFPREHLVIAWKSVDFPTLARPTCKGVKVSENYPTIRDKTAMYDRGKGGGDLRRNPQFHSSNYSRASRA